MTYIKCQIFNPTSPPTLKPRSNGAEAIEKSDGSRPAGPLRAPLFLGSVTDSPAAILSTQPRRLIYCALLLCSGSHLPDSPPRSALLTSRLPMLTLLSQRASVGAAAFRGAAMMAVQAASTRAACTVAASAAASAAAVARSRSLAVAPLARPSSSAATASAAPRRVFARAFHSCPPRHLQLGGGPPSGHGGGGGGGEEGAQGTWVNPANVPAGEALKKFCHDLTQMAKDGKLDPVSTTAAQLSPLESTARCASESRRFWHLTSLIVPVLVTGDWS